MQSPGEVFMPSPQFQDQSYAQSQQPYNQSYMQSQPIESTDQSFIQSPEPQKAQVDASWSASPQGTYESYDSYSAPTGTYSCDSTNPHVYSPSSMLCSENPSQYTYQSSPVNRDDSGIESPASTHSLITNGSTNYTNQHMYGAPQ